MDHHELIVGGLTPFTTIDYPGKLAAVLFCQGCPWRCTYCHNTHLRKRNGIDKYSWPDILGWLKVRQGLLDSIVFSGGEPLLQRSLPEAIAEVKEMGFLIGIHTAGVYPDRLRTILPHLDWIGLDIKAPFSKYDHITRAHGGEKARESLAIILSSGKDHEVRCTVDPALLKPEDIALMAQQIAEMGGASLILQPYRKNGQTSVLLDQTWVEAANQYLEKVEIRST